MTEVHCDEKVLERNSVQPAGIWVEWAFELPVGFLFWRRGFDKRAKLTILKSGGVEYLGHGTRTHAKANIVCAVPDLQG